MSKLKELEKRLRDEPDNLGLRVMVAGALHEAGRRDDAIELYRSVAIAYRDRGRPQQAITVCRSILELAPDDGPCTELLAALLASQPAHDEPRPGRPSPPPSRSSPPPRASPPPSRLSPPPRLRQRSPSPEERPSEPARRSSGDVTPLPPPLPYHVADPTVSSMPRLSRSDLPPSLQEELAGYPEIAGIANAARQISASLIAASQPDEDDLAFEVDTGRVPRTAAGEARGARWGPVGGVAADLGDGDDDPTLPPRGAAGSRGDDDPIRLPHGASASRGDDEMTEPRDRPLGMRPPGSDAGARVRSIAAPTAATGPLSGAFFAPVPPHSRPAVLQRFRRRMAAGGMTVIRRGETGHGLVVVVRGRLELHADRADGSLAVIDAIAPGEYIGEASLLARAPAAADVVAAEESELLVLAAADFYDVTGAFPALWAELTEVAERRTRDHAQRL